MANYEHKPISFFPMLGKAWRYVDA